MAEVTGPLFIGLSSSADDEAIQEFQTDDGSSGRPIYLMVSADGSYFGFANTPLGIGYASGAGLRNTSFCSLNFGFGSQPWTGKVDNPDQIQHLEIVKKAMNSLGQRLQPSGNLGHEVFTPWGLPIEAKNIPKETKEKIAKAVEIVSSIEGEKTRKLLPEEQRLALLDSAARQNSPVVDPINALEERSRDKAVELLGGEAVLGRPVRNDEDLVLALTVGFPVQTLRSLQEAGYPHKILEQIVAPRRTLMRRRGKEQRLTRSESDAVWRLAHVLVLASGVLNGAQAAIAWLSRAKTAFANQTPVDLLETSVGTAHVERLLKRLDWGDVA